jgi:predicted metal-dependent HD superfamily phosphohydrolase
MQALRHSWRRAWAGVGAHGDGARLLQRLIARYREPHRKYQRDPRVALAADELQSANWARSELLEAGVPATSAQRVHALVLATRHATFPVRTCVTPSNGSGAEPLCRALAIGMSRHGAPRKRCADTRSKGSIRWHW